VIQGGAEGLGNALLRGKKTAENKLLNINHEATVGANSFAKAVFQTMKIHRMHLPLRE
jgi:hypothetical protein